jgi:hypothetical protein
LIKIFSSEAVAVDGDEDEDEDEDKDEFLISGCISETESEI